MKSKKVSFTNKTGKNLVGKLDMPIDRHPHNYVIFAHCFTCNKNLMAVKNISKANTRNGFAVLRFDFTGLGESEGDFEDTNFSGNVEDLIAAAAYLKSNHDAPTMLLGHSLGGAAVIFAAEEIDTIKAIATVGAPSNPIHVKHLFKDNLEDIHQKGEAEVLLAGRPFKIKSNLSMIWLPSHYHQWLNL